MTSELDGDESERADGMIGATQPAYRAVVTDGDETAYLYVVQLGPTLEDGPNLVARTTSEMGGDFGLNRAILDRMMAHDGVHRHHPVTGAGR